MTLYATPYSANIRAERARKGWRQVDLAQRIGVPRSTLQAIETGRRRLFIEEALDLTTALGITLEDLMRDHA